MSPPGRRSRPTATNGEPAQIVDTTPTTPRVRRRSDNADDAALFDVIVDRNAYGTSLSYRPTAEMAQAMDTAGDWWQSLARQAIVAIAETRDTFTIDDLRDTGLVPDPINPSSAWGAAVSGAANSGLITNVGYRKSRRKAAHSRIVSVWTRAR